jgi:glyoxylase-like metal-dependent hydrolase (beta-lactamase superfamily II)
MILRQLFDPESSTYTYLVADPLTKEAAIIDSVREQSARDLAVIQELGLKLKFIIETHLHADHVTGASLLRDATGAKVAICRTSGVKCAVIFLGDGDELKLGAKVIRAIATPGHTGSCLSFYCEGAVYTGDTLFIRDVGRTDFQEGSNAQMYESVTKALFSLPGETIVYPAHDYKGRFSSTIAEEKELNLKIGNGRSLAQFESEMQAMKLAPPKKINVALPVNLNCGRDLDDQ